MSAGAETPVPLDPPVPGLEDAKNQLKRNCEEEWEKLSQTQRTIAREQVPVTVGEGHPQTAILATKERLLEAQISTLKHTQPQLLSPDPLVQHELHTADLKASIEQLEQVLSLVNTHRLEMGTDIQRWRQYIDETSQMGLEAKIEEQTQLDDNVSDNSILKTVEKKEAKLLTYHKQLMKHMASFVQEHFPPPSREELEISTRKRHPSGAFTRDHVPLRDIVEELVNTCIETPHSPYLTLTEHHWTPHIQLLVRVGIALRHPDNDSMIKLTPFHL